MKNKTKERPNEHRKWLARTFATTIKYAHDAHVEADKADNPTAYRFIVEECERPFQSQAAGLIPMICRDADPAGLMGLIQDAINGKRRGPYDEEIIAAYEEACIARRRSLSPERKEQIAHAARGRLERLRRLDLNGKPSDQWIATKGRHLEAYEREVILPGCASFSEFKEEFKKRWKNNPDKFPLDKSLRRTLARLNCLLRPDKLNLH